MLTRREFVSTSMVGGAALSGAAGLTSGQTNESIAQRVRDAKPLDIEVIDSHAHFSGVMQGGQLPAGVGALLRAMDRCGINLSLFSNSSAIGASSPEGFRAGNEAAIAAVKAHPDRLRGYLVFQPHFVDASLAMAEHILDPDLGLVGFKLHGVSHNYPVDGEGYRQAYQFAHQHNLPVLFHVKSSHGTETPTLRNEPLPVVLSRVLSEFTRMKLVIAHFGRGIEDWADFTAEHPNAFMETAASGCSFSGLGEDRGVRRTQPDSVRQRLHLPKPGRSAREDRPGRHLRRSQASDLPIKCECGLRPEHSSGSELSRATAEGPSSLGRGPLTTPPDNLKDAFRLGTPPQPNAVRVRADRALNQSRSRCRYQ